MSVDQILHLLRSSVPADRQKGYALVAQVADAELPSLEAGFGQLEPPADEPEASLYWKASNDVSRRCFLTSPRAATEFAEAMDDDTCGAVAELFLNAPDGSAREAEFLDALLPVYLPTVGTAVLKRTLPPVVRARVFAHLIEIESSGEDFGSEYAILLSEEPPAIVTLANEIIQHRATAGLSDLLSEG